MLSNAIQQSHYCPKDHPQARKLHITSKLEQRRIPDGLQDSLNQIRNQPHLPLWLRLHAGSLVPHLGRCGRHQHSRLQKGQGSCTSMSSYNNTEH